MLIVVTFCGQERQGKTTALEAANGEVIQKAVEQMTKKLIAIQKEGADDLAQVMAVEVKTSQDHDQLSRTEQQVLGGIGQK